MSALPQLPNQSDNGDQFIVGGVEHMGHVGMTYGIDPNPKASKKPETAWMMGVAPEVLSKCTVSVANVKMPLPSVPIGLLSKQGQQRFDKNSGH